MKRAVQFSRLGPYNEANPVRKQDPVSPAHALLQKAMWPRHYLLIMFLYKNPGATKQGISDLLNWPLWKVQGLFTKMFHHGLMTRRNVGSRRYRYYLTREAFLIAQAAAAIEEVLIASGRIQGAEE